jgi:hypothetical protein
MASKFSTHVLSRDCTGGRNDHLTHSPYVSSSRYFALDILNSCSATQQIPSSIVTAAHHYSGSISYPFMEPRRMAPVRSWRNQGGLV